MLAEYWWALLSLLFLSLLVHLTIDKLILFFNTDAKTIAPVLKAVVFFVAFVALVIPIAKDSWSIWRKSSWRDILIPLAVALGVMVVSMALTFQRGPLALGVDYSLRSASPFTQISDWQNTRLLMPALSYFLLLRGTWPFYAFFLALTFLFIAMLYSWTRAHAPLSLWEFLSLCTASFVVYQFQIPGYPDILVFIFFLLVMRSDFSPAAKLSALLLALIAYEASFIIGLILAWKYLPRKEQIAYLLGIGIYGLVWLGVWNLDVAAILSSHNVEGMSGLQWVLQHPTLEFFGVLAAFKALWVVMLWAASSAVPLKRSEAAFILLIIGGGILMTISAVDTSRLMGYAFPALLSSLALLTNPPASGTTGRRVLSLLFGVNLLIPSVYVGLNSGPRTFRGLYGRLYRWLTQ